MSADIAKINLKYPVEDVINKVTIRELVFSRRLRVNDFYGCSDPLTWEDQVNMISRLTEIHKTVLERIDASDFVNAIQVLNSFLGFSQPTGGSVLAS
jgi:hypothetical protein